MVMVEKGVLQSAASSAFAASRALRLAMPTSALQAVSFRSAPSARFIWYLCRVDGVDACSLIKDAGVAQNFPPLVHGGRALEDVRGAAGDGGKFTRGRFTKTTAPLSTISTTQ